MIEFFLHDLGIACLVLWLILLILLFWYVRRVSPSNEDQNNSQEPNDEEASARDFLLEHFREDANLDYPKEDDEHQPEQPANS